MLTDDEMLQKLQESLELNFDDQQDLFLIEDESGNGQLLMVF
ncbi:hypothetical protein [Candidatus Neptunichlamydia sp. REUL1]|nr:hypothetical protein [Candidatus Neptunochlamydia sp. REUL1]